MFVTQNAYSEALAKRKHSKNIMMKCEITWNGFYHETERWIIHSYYIKKKKHKLIYKQEWKENRMWWMGGLDGVATFTSITFDVPIYFYLIFPLDFFLTLTNAHHLLCFALKKNILFLNNYF